jgi:hypothetical protein
MRWFPDFK